MRFAAHLLTLSFVASLVSVESPAQTVIANRSSIASAKTIFFDDQSGMDAVGQKALAELIKWGRFVIVQDRKNADLIVLLVRDPHRGGNLILSGGQTGTVDSGGHVEEDPAPDFNKQTPVSYAFLVVTDRQTGKPLWSASHRWGGLLTGFDSVGERLVKEFETETEATDRAAKLKVVKSVNPEYPPGLSSKGVHGTVVVQVVVDKHGKVTSAKALSGPSDLVRASEETARQWQFEPPAEAPVTTKLEMSYEYSPAPCPPGKQGHLPIVFFAQKLPLISGHPGDLKIVDYIEAPMPPYPEEARTAGIEGDLDLSITVNPHGQAMVVQVVNSLNPVIDKAAVDTVLTWKFKVTHGGMARFPLKISYRMTCDSSDGE